VRLPPAASLQTLARDGTQPRGLGGAVCTQLFGWVPGVVPPGAGLRRRRFATVNHGDRTRGTGHPLGAVQRFGGPPGASAYGANFCD